MTLFQKRILGECEGEDQNQDKQSREEREREKDQKEGKLLRAGQLGLATS